MSTDLVAWAGDVADKIAETALLKRAETEARALLSRVQGRVLASEEDAAEVTDLLKRVGVGRRHLKDALETAIAPLKLAQKAVTKRLAVLRDTLDEADTEGRAALRCWMIEKQRLQQAEDEKRRQERVVAEKAAIEAARQGRELAPPVVDVPSPPPSKSTYGAVGQSYGTHPLCVELMDLHEVASFAPSLLSLNESAAKTLYREAEKTMALDGATSHPSGGLVWHGMRFWRDLAVAVK